MKKLFILILLTSFFVFSCKSKKKAKNEVSIHLLSDPDKLLPFASTSADATFIERYIFQKLIDWDYEKNTFVGILAKSRPNIVKENGKLMLEYEIREEAKWDNGTDITAKDVEFSYKTVMNPKTSCEQLRPYYDYIDDIILDSLNPKKFKVVSNKSYILIEEYSGYWVLPEYIYDPEHIMRKFKLTELKTNINNLKSNADILKFANQFNSQKFMREKGFVVGSGPYKFDEWVTGSKIILTKKENWWGHKSNDTNLKNSAYINKIVLRIINDWNTTSTAIKSGELDCIKSIEYKIFNTLKNEPKFKELYTQHNPSTEQYLYIGFNLTNEKLKDLNVRKAISHTIDKNLIINTLLYGYAENIESMVQPSKSYYNKQLKPFDYNLDLANDYMEKAGWKDSDGDGLRDKIINGKKVDFVIDYKYNAGNDTRKNIGLLMKENLKKIGIEVNIIVKEWTVYLDELKNHNFEIYCGAWSGDPNVEDPKQIWHTESTKGGSNYVHFGDKASDILIDNIREELNDTKRNEMYHILQEKVHNDLPYLFLFSLKERMAFSKKFNNTNSYTSRPGFDILKWKLK